jgi:hypothetical protein
MSKSNLFLLVIVSFLSSSIVSEAFGEKLCLKTTVDKKTLKAKHQSALAEKCPSGYVAIADSDYFVGPKGDVGPTGATGAQGSAGTSGNTGPQGPAGLVLSLFDSTDVTIGPIINIGCQQFFSDNQRRPIERVSVLLTIGGRTFPICASLDEFVPTGDIAFASTGCTGQAYLFPYSVPAASSTIFSAGIVTAAGSQRILYRPDYVTGASSVTRRSYYNTDGQCTDATATESLFPAIQVSNLSTAYPAPLEAR